MKKTIAIVLLILSFFIIFFLQSNLFTWFTIAGVMPNLYVILILFIGLFAKKKIGLIFGLLGGLYLDILLSKVVGISALGFAIIGILGEIFAKNFAKDSRLTIMLMVVGSTLIYENITYFANTFIAGNQIEVLAFIRIVVIEIIFNSLLTIILYPLIKKLGYKLEETFEDKKVLTRYF